MVWRPEDPQGGESMKVRHMIVPWTIGRVLELGAGPWRAWPHFTTLDNVTEWRDFPNWKPDIKGDATDLSMFADRSFDAVFSSHLLEHLEQPEEVLQEWWRVVKVGGYLILYLPHKDHYPRIGTPWANLDHKSDFGNEDIIDLMPGGWDLVHNEIRTGGMEYSFLQAFKKVKGSSRTVSYVPREKRGKTVVVTRYGGIGDMIQASSILWHLKREGYHVTLNCKPMGREVLLHDPNVDAFWVQEHDQVPNGDTLTNYWKAMGREFDRAINLSETCEGLVMALPGRRSHALTYAAKRIVFDHNYLEVQHAAAGVPYEGPKQAFYPTPEEDAEAKRLREAWGPEPLIAYSIAGSSVHKMWPYVDALAVWVLLHTNAKLLLMGDPDCQVVELGVMQAIASVVWGMPEQESHELGLAGLLAKAKEYFGSNRILCASGRWKIRQTLSFLPHADLIIGPETGIMNAAAMLEVPKILILSHSSFNNLPRDWRNTLTIQPDDVPCHPCHAIHYSFEHCFVDEKTGAAACASSVSAGFVIGHVQGMLEMIAAKAGTEDGLRDTG